MNIEGKLHIDIYRADGSVSNVAIQSSRPLQAARVFEGKKPDQLHALLPLVYSVCATAQSRAALMASRQALGVDVDEKVDAAEKILVLFETAREHLVRILIDWPQYSGEKSSNPNLAAITRLVPEAKSALFVNADAFSLQAQVSLQRQELESVLNTLISLLRESVFGCLPDNWLDNQTLQQFDQWIGTHSTCATCFLEHMMEMNWQQLGRAQPAYLPFLDDNSLHHRLTAIDAESFIAEPTYEGSTCETTSLLRMQSTPLIEALVNEYGNGLLARTTARLVELAGIPQRINELLSSISQSKSSNYGLIPDAWDGAGIGQVEAARGHLVHRIELKNGRIDRYQILAPTEWNFHPRGIVAQGLQGMDAVDETVLRRQTALLINAVDPCVSYELGVH